MGEERPRSSGCPSWNTATSFSSFFAGLHPLFGYLGLRNLRQLADPMCQPQLDHSTRQGKFLAAFQRGECSSTLKVLKDDQGKMSPPDDLAFFFAGCNHREVLSWALYMLSNIIYKDISIYYVLQYYICPGLKMDYTIPISGDGHQSSI